MVKNKKDIAVALLELAASGNVRAAYRSYVHPDFRHHNPYFRGDRESLLVGMEESAAKFPHKVLRVIRALEDGAYIVVHGEVQLAPDLPGVALIHIFRFEDGLIIEEWEAAQEWPAKSLNENGMF